MIRGKSTPKQHIKSLNSTEEDDVILQMSSSSKNALDPNATTILESTKTDDDNSLSISTQASLQIGDMGMVTWRDGKEKLLAIIVERRPVDYWSNPTKRKKGNHEKSKNCSTTTTALETMTKAESWHYYVHYVHHDR